MSDKAYLAALARVDDLKRQRAQLRETLEALVNYYPQAMQGGIRVDGSGMTPLDKARAALKATEEG